MSNYYLKFTGSEKVDVESNSVFNFEDSDFSISFWIRIESSNDGAIIDHYNHSTGEGWWIWLDGTTVKFVASNIVLTTVVPQIISLNEWQLVTFVHNTTANTIAPYLNSVAGTPVAHKSKQTTKTPIQKGDSHENHKGQKSKRKRNWCPTLYLV